MADWNIFVDFELKKKEEKIQSKEWAMNTEQTEVSLFRFDMYYIRILIFDSCHSVLSLQFCSSFSFQTISMLVAFCIFLLYINRTTTCLCSAVKYFFFRSHSVNVWYVIHTESISSLPTTWQHLKNCSLLCLIFSRFGYFSSSYTSHHHFNFELHGIVLKGNRTQFLSFFFLLCFFSFFLHFMF